MIARLTALDQTDGKVYVLATIGEMVRRVGTRYKVDVRFLAEDGNGQKHIAVDLDLAPFLILGSRWHRGIMVGADARLVSVTLDNDATAALRWVNLSPEQSAFEGGLLVRGPVLQIINSPLLTYYLPAFELMRAHYLFQPRIARSFLGGLLQHKRFTNPKLEAWRVDTTRWLTHNHACIHRGSFVHDDDAKRLARLLFNPDGERGISEIYKMAQHLVLQKGGETRCALPMLPLPYAQARWSVVVAARAQPGNGNEEFLIRRIVDFQAPEPYERLTIDDEWPDPAQTEDEPGSNEDADEGIGGGWFEPNTRNQLDIEDGGSDGRLLPVSIDDIQTVDQDSQWREAEKTGGDRQGRNGRGVAGSSEVATGSFDEPGADGRGRAPVRLGSDNVIQSDNETMRDQRTQLLDAIQPAIDAHASIGIETVCKALPDSHHTYCFSTNKVRREVHDPQYRARKFIVIEVQISGRFAYFVDPERTGADRFSLRLWTQKQTAQRRDASRLADEDIVGILKSYVDEERDDVDPQYAASLNAQYEVRRIIHGREKDPRMDELVRFARRVSHALNSAIGDPALSGTGSGHEARRADEGRSQARVRAAGDPT